MSQLAQRLIMAAGGAKKETTYVEDVFSTYLYKGNDNHIHVTNGVKLSNANQGSSVSMLGDGSGSGYGTGCIYVPATADFKFGTGAFTIEFFIYFVHSTDYIAVFDGRTNNSNNNNDRTVTGLLANGQFNWYNLGTGAVIANSAATQVTANAWSHVAYVREGTGTNQAKMYINGSLVGTGTDPKDYNVNQPCRIGGHAWSPGVLHGSFSNYRVVKGTAVYTSNFTPPTKELTAISGTVLLCCQSSTDPFAATVSPGGTFTNGNNNSSNPIAESFGPFTGKGGKGGLVWMKSRDTGYGHFLFDTERGTTKAICTNLTNTEFTEAKGVTSFNNSGFTIGGTGADGAFNANNVDYASWTFAKQEGFFDIVKYTGNNVAGRQIPHNLGCTPGFYTIKCLRANNEGEAQEWTSYHTSYGAGQKFYLNKTDSASSTGYIGPATDTYFTVPTTGATAGQINVMNRVGVDYVAYLWAGGQSPIDYSTYLDGSGDYLSLPASNDLELDGDFTIECWVYNERVNNNERQTIIGNNISWTTNQSCLQICNPSNGAYYNSVTLWDYNSDTNAPIAYSVGLTGNTGWVLKHSWHHIAVVRKSNNIRIYIDGALSNYTNQNNSATLHFGTGETWIGKVNISNECYNGKISNLRVVKGQALYETNFAVPQSPLTTTSQGATASNVKLLCCNTSTTTGSTVTPGTITANGDAAVNSNNPFMDANSKIFGKDGDQNIIACGKYTGKSEGADGPWVDLGWQPQWILIKRSNGSAAWQLFDTMRGIVTGGNDMIFNPDNAGAEITTQNRLRVMPLGFRLDENDSDTSSDNCEFVYMAIRKPDSYVGRPAEVGTDSFTMNAPTGSASTPEFISNFPVDYGIYRKPASAQSWFNSARLITPNELKTDDPAQESAWANGISFDYNNGWGTSGQYTPVGAYQSWMWKRGAGFDVLNYYGNATAGRSVHHSLGVPPEMIWIKTRTNGYDWIVYNKFLNGGVTPEQWAVKLGYDTVEQQKDWFNNQAPTATEFFVDGSATSNNNRDNFIAILFASVNGISKVASFVGNGTSQSIPLGFQPRFLILKNVTSTEKWYVVDTVRGWGSGGDQYLSLNTNYAQANGTFGEPTATGFDISGNDAWNNKSGDTFIYYAHA